MSLLCPCCGGSIEVVAPSDDRPARLAYRAVERPEAIELSEAIDQLRDTVQQRRFRDEIRDAMAEVFRKQKWYEHARAIGGGGAP